jgi:hypothetical protein
VRLAYVLKHVGRFGTITEPGKDGKGEYRAAVNGKVLAWREVAPGEVAHVEWVMPGHSSGAGNYPLADALRMCLWATHEEEGPGLVHAEYSLDRHLREYVRVTVRPRVARANGGAYLGESGAWYDLQPRPGGQFILTRKDGEAFALARDFARGESGMFLDWLQDRRPEAFA